MLSAKCLWHLLTACLEPWQCWLANVRMCKLQGILALPISHHIYASRLLLISIFIFSPPRTASAEERRLWKAIFCLAFRGSWIMLDGVGLTCADDCRWQKNTALEVTDSSVIKQSNSTSWQGSILGELIGAGNKGSVILNVIWSIYVFQCVPLCFWLFLTLTCCSSRINGCQQTVSVIILGLLAWMTTRLRHQRRVLHLPRPRRNRLKIMFLIKRSQLRVRQKKESPALARWEGSAGPHHTLLDEGARFSGFTMFHLQEVTFHSS